jgi:hypothetical protein
MLRGTQSKGQMTQIYVFEIDVSNCSVGGGDLGLGLLFGRHVVSIHAPRGGEGLLHQQPGGSHVEVSIHAPRVASQPHTSYHCQQVSIHAPRVGSDPRTSSRCWFRCRFNPRPRVARATADRYVESHKRFLDRKNGNRLTEAISVPTEDEIKEMVAKLTPRLVRVLTTPESITKFLREITAALQPSVSAA